LVDWYPRGQVWQTEFWSWKCWRRVWNRSRKSFEWGIKWSWV